MSESSGGAMEPSEGERGGKDDAPPSAERVRGELRAFARLLLRLEREDRLLRALPLVLRRLGDLRRLLFDYEVRSTERLLPVEDPVEREARRLVREAREREEEMVDEWGEGWRPEEPEEDD